MEHCSRAWQVCGAVVLSAMIGSTGMAVASRSEMKADTVRTSLVRERDRERDDAADRVDEHHGTTPAPPGDVSQAIVVTVPRIAVFTIDGTGRITSAATNTGRAPAAGDTTYVIGSDGSYQPTAVDLSRRHWKGDFSDSMRFQRQSGEEQLTPRSR
jgi:hypothetical protein